jgi:hypothetical protein
MTLRVVLALALVAAASARAADVFVSPEGRDDAAGTREAPFATLTRAQQRVAPGDTVHLRGGRYRMPATGIAATKDIWAYVILLHASGAEGRPITYAAFGDERPVFEFHDVTPRKRINAFQVTGSWIRLVGIEITGVRGVLTGHAQSACIENTGSHNRFERIAMHDNEAIGFYGVRGKDVAVVDCDAWNNHDPTAEDGRGGNTDGFGCHPPRGSTGWVFRRCRAWLNADDGFDCIAAYEPVVFEECWAFRNGFDSAMRPLADGNGFKAGGYGGLPADRLPAEIPRHVIHRCVAARNRAAGFYANHHPGGCDWLANSAYRNAVNFDMRGRLADNVTPSAGRGHVLRDNLATGSGRPLANIDATACTLDHNLFAGGSAAPRLADAAFASLDADELAAPRPSAGGLPAITFLHPQPDGAAAGYGAFAPASPDR